MKVIFRCVDLETGGMDPTDGIIEMGWTDLTWDPLVGQRELGVRESLLFRNPYPLTADNVAVHHLTEAMLAEWPLCGPDDIASLMHVCDEDDATMGFLVAHNAAFEQQFLDEELGNKHRWICTYKVALRLYPDAPSHSNQALRYYLGHDALPEHLAMPPHRAGPDSYVTAHILASMLETGTTVNQMVRWTLEPRYYATCPLGKHKGHPWSTVPHGYLDWMLKQSDMEDDIQHAARIEIERRRGEGT